MKLKIIYSVLFSILLAFMGCKKEADPGPAGPAGIDGKILEDYYYQNGSVKLQIFMKASDGETDSLLTTTEYLYQNKREHSHYSEGGTGSFSITMFNLENKTSIFINSGNDPNNDPSEIYIGIDYEIKKLLGNGKWLILSDYASSGSENLTISNYSFNKATSKIKFDFETMRYSHQSESGGTDLKIKGGIESTLNQEIYARSGTFNK